MKSIMEIIRDMFGWTNGCSCEDVDYLTERIKTLSEELALCIGPIDIIEEYKTSVCPYDVIYGYDLIIADSEYLTYSIEDWKAIMFRLHRHFDGKFEYYSNISDCDNFALLHASIIAYSAYRTGLSKQPAFCIIWSNIHAYNGFITSDNEVFLYEPQTGDMIGRLGEDLGEMYDSKKIWFLS